MKVFLSNHLKDYFRFFQVPARKWWAGLIALVATVTFYLGYTFIFTKFLTPNAVHLVVATEWKTIIDHLMGNLLLGGLIGLSVLVSWLFFRQGFGWLSSVVGRFRWKWFALTITISAIVFFILNICQVWLFNAPEELEKLSFRPYSVFTIVVILLSTPFQAAGEEFLFRGILGRLIATSIPSRKVGLALSALITTLVFMFLHSDTHLINNIFYITLSLTAWWLAYRTGGIEASIALHLCGNVSSQLVEMPFMDLSNPLGRTDDGGSMIGLIVIQILLTLVIDLLARRRGLVSMSSPGATIPEIVRIGKMVTNITASLEPATKEDLPRIDTTIREVITEKSK